MANGTYQPTVMQSPAYDYEIMNTRSKGSAYEISLPRELAGGSTPRQVPLLFGWGMRDRFSLSVGA